MPSLVPLLKEKGLKESIRVTTRYKDLAGESYESEWTLNPLLFEDAPINASRGIDDLVKVMAEIREDIVGWDGRTVEISKEEVRSPGL